MAQTLQTLSIISFAVAGVCLALGIFFWFFFKIPTVIGDLSGRTARKSIAKMRANNEKTGVKSYKESKTNAERGKITDTMPDSDKLKKPASTNDDKVETGILTENKADELESETTGLLVDENATMALDLPERQQPIRTGGKKLEMIEEVIVIHTEETI